MWINKTLKCTYKASFTKVRQCTSTDNRKRGIVENGKKGLAGHSSHRAAWDLDREPLWLLINHVFPLFLLLSLPLHPPRPLTHHCPSLITEIMPPSCPYLPLTRAPTYVGDDICSPCRRTVFIPSCLRTCFKRTRTFAHTYTTRAYFIAHVRSRSCV